MATAWRGRTGPGLRHNKIMIISSPYVIILSAEERHELTVRASSARAAHRDVVRATPTQEVIDTPAQITA